MTAARAARRVLAVLACLACVPLAGCAHFVILRDPLTASEHNDLGVVYERAGEADLAAREYRHAVRLEPHRAGPRVNLGNVEAARGRWGRAERCFRLALRDSATDADAMNNLAVVLLQRRHRLEEARRFADRAVAGGGERDSIYRATRDDVDAALRADALRVKRKAQPAGL